MSNTRRFAAAGFALAISGSFIAVPAQADAATASTHSVAKAAVTGAHTTNGAASAQSNYKSLISSAKTSEQVQALTGGRSSIPVTAKTATSPIIYVEADPDHCQSEEGAGTQDDPYCLLQSAVNAAKSGDTIEVYQIETDDEKLDYNERVSIVGAQNLTIIGEGDGVGDVGPVDNNALYISGSTNVTIRNMVFDDGTGNTVDLFDDTNTTLDGDYIVNDDSTQPALYVTGGNTGVTITRSSIANNGGGFGVKFEANSTNLLLASNLIYGAWTGVYAGGDSDLDITGNTMQAGCAGDVTVTGTSSAVAIENNVFEPPLTATCTADGGSLAPDVYVDASAAAAVTSDYNDFTFGSDGTSAYDWAGTSYPTLAAFQAAVAQGAHDAIDPTAYAKMFLTPAGVDGNGTTLTMDGQPVSTSLSIGTGNPEAPNGLNSDYFGQSPYTDRGAIQYAATSVSPQLVVYKTGARTIEASADESVDRNAYATYVYTWGDGTTTASTTSANVTHVYAHPGSYSVDVTETDAFGDTATRQPITVTTAGSDFVPVTPTRILDTRKGIGTGGVVAKIGAGKSLVLTVGGVGAVPTGATAAAINITATDATAGGHINAYPDDPSDPTPSSASNLDFAKGKNVANMAVVAIGTDRKVDFLNGSSGTVDLVVDISGYFVTAQGDGYKQVVPARILDTNTTTGGHKAALTPSDPIKLKVAGVGGVPADVKAVEVNLTVASPTKSSLVTAYPDGGSEPTVSNVNFTGGQTIANAAIVPVGSDGYIDIKTPVGSNRMIVDVDGYFSANLTEAPSAYEPVTPYRYLDTRDAGYGPIPGDESGYYSYETLPLGLDWWYDLATPTVTGVVTNVTVTQVQASGVLAVFPDNYLSNGDLDIPNVSSLDFTKGATVANLVFSTPGTDGIADYLNNSSGSVQLIVDYFGLFEAS